MPYSLYAILPSPKDGIKGDIFIRCPTTGQPIMFAAPPMMLGCWVN
jgi:hypothetical protein